MHPDLNKADVTEGLRRGFLIGLAVAAVFLPPALPARQAPNSGGVTLASLTPHTPRIADFADYKPSADARLVADWVATTRDNAGGDFVIIDKKAAHLFVFDANAKLRASTPVLLGSMREDYTVPGIGQRPVELVRPEERTTPAGRFVAERGMNAIGQDVVWIDYESAVAMHRVRTTNPKERRLERLESETIDDNRISYGCINIPVAFFEQYVAPAFAKRKAMVYVLPDVKPVREVFNMGNPDTLQASTKQGAAT